MPKQHLSIIIVPHTKTSTRTLCFTRKTLKALAAAGAALGLVLAAVLVDYVRMTVIRGRYRALKAETAEQPKEAWPRAVASGEPTSLLLDAPVRSGQSILFPNGDVTVVGSVASGAEIVAGGSIHIYGALRGRAIAGATGNGNARIFCRKFEAELLAIDGLYKTADSIEPSLRGQPIQAWIERDAIRIAPVANNNH